MKTYKCGYKYCKNNGVVERELAIKLGARYYCKECADEIDGKRRIRERYIKDIDKYPNVSQLNNAIKKIINDYKCEIDFVLYAFDYIKANKIQINNPFGLTWVVKDGKLINKYKQEIILKKANDIRRSIDIDVETDFGNNFKYKESKPKWMKKI